MFYSFDGLTEGQMESISNSPLRSTTEDSKENMK